MHFGEQFLGDSLNLMAAFTGVQNPCMHFLKQT